jgi:hypothetical protein
VVGPITNTTAPALRDVLRRTIDDPTGPCPRLRLDLTCCTNIDLDGLLALTVAQHAAQLRGGDLRLEHVPPLIENQVRQHNFDDLLAPASAGDA